MVYDSYFSTVLKQDVRTELLVYTIEVHPREHTFLTFYIHTNIS